MQMHHVLHSLCGIDVLFCALPQGRWMPQCGNERCAYWVRKFIKDSQIHIGLSKSYLPAWSLSWHYGRLAVLMLCPDD